MLPLFAVFMENVNIHKKYAESLCKITRCIFDKNCVYYNSILIYRRLSNGICHVSGD